MAGGQGGGLGAQAGVAERHRHEACFQCQGYLFGREIPLRADKYGCGSPGRYSRASRRRGLSASQWAMNFWGMEALSAMKRLSGVMGQISGMVALRLCFTAERAMRSSARA